MIAGQEAKHIARVLRMQPEDAVVLIDGSGMEFFGKIDSISESDVTVTIEHSRVCEAEPHVHVTIAQAIIKSDHLDYVVQKCTELGASAFLPFVSQRCVKRPDAKSAEKLREREQKIAAGASKQSGRAVVPEVSGVLTFAQLVKRVQSGEALYLLAYEDEKNTSIKRVLQAHADAGAIMVIIGPEGGFAPEEAQALMQAGAVVCSLGKLILRAETAGVAAMAMIQYEEMESGA